MKYFCRDFVFIASIVDYLTLGYSFPLFVDYFHSQGAVYAHPIEFIFGNVAGVALGPVLFKAHPYTAYFWYAFALNTSCRHHSGYDFFDAQEHDTHHEVFNYNYGVFLDDIFGTKLIKAKHP